MLKNDYADQDCSIARALEVVGERWTLLIVRELVRRPRRFLQLERTLAVAKNVLANRLQKMITMGIAEKASLSPARDWGEYRLTSKGRDLFPVIYALMAWGDEYAAPDGPPLVLKHKCGHNPGHKVVCKCCGEELRPQDLRVDHSDDKAVAKASGHPR
jgi:DNA-binding HxlR family transcriptional regulator